MGRVIVLKFEGDFDIRGFQVTLEIRSELNQIEVEERGQLAPNPALMDALQAWQEKYRNIGAPTRIKPKRILYDGSIQKRRADCNKAAATLRDRFKDWLKSDSFRSIDLQLREELHRDEEVRLLLRSSNQALQKLPWHEWDFVQRYPNTEVVLTALNQRSRKQSAAQSIHKNRVLAILGHSHGIDVEADRHLLEGLSNSEVTFLVEPQRQQLGDRLWEQPWDVIFFAGHSETEGETGRIYLNPTDSLTIEELWFALRKAVDRGLKLAIFNSCDGLGLVQQLNDLAIPHLIVMRELVPDRVAQEFLKYLLTALSDDKPVHLAMREARERLETLEDEFPCATWLPVIHQNVDYTPVTLLKPAKLFPIKQILFVSLAVTLLVMGIRWTGLLQSAELQAYDHLMRSRPAEAIDPNIVVVEITQEDINKAGSYPIKDDQLAMLIQKIAHAKPSVIGLTLHRHQPRPPGRQDLIAQFQNPNLTTVCSFWARATDSSTPPAEFSFQQRDEQMGFSDFLRDEPPISPNVIRRQLLSYDPKKLDHPSPCITPYSFSLQIARKFLEPKNRPIALNEQTNEWHSDRITLKRLRAHTAGYQQLDGLSNQVLIHYSATLKPAQKVSMGDILERQQTDFLKDRAVIIGYDDRYQNEDIYQTPMGELSGVWVHTHIISQIIRAELEGRSLIWLLPQWENFQWGDSFFVSLWALLGGTMVWMVRSPRWLMGFTAISLFTLYQLCLSLLIYGGWMPLIPAAIALLGAGSWSASLRYRLQKKH
jgi:CHASE2 domain-containing sensor protein